MPKFPLRGTIGTALQFFGLGLCVHDFWVECEKISSPLRIHGFWIGVIFIVSGWIILSLDNYEKRRQVGKV
jgi:hypothetical protein